MHQVAFHVQTLHLATSQGRSLPQCSALECIPSDSTSKILNLHQFRLLNSLFPKKTAGMGTVLTVEEYLARDVESLHLGRDANKLAVIQDPAGYCWEALERNDKQVAEPLCKVSDFLHACCILDVCEMWCSDGHEQTSRSAPL